MSIFIEYTIIASIFVIFFFLHFKYAIWKILVKNALYVPAFTGIWSTRALWGWAFARPWRRGHNGTVCGVRTSGHGRWDSTLIYNLYLCNKTDFRCLWGGKHMQLTCYQTINWNCSLFSESRKNRGKCMKWYVLFFFFRETWSFGKCMK